LLRSCSLSFVILCLKHTHHVNRTKLSTEPLAVSLGAWKHERLGRGTAG
jgi:hypothetical protein